ncbi:MAG TPA: hypothetical protein VMU64_09300 [Acidimicrobiales bacterium]|nr:hypothetical protein [Acidimicrobiales bacterium]
MSIVDDRMHVGGDRPRAEGLWQTTDPTAFVSSPSIASEGGTTPNRSMAAHPSNGRSADLFARAGAGGGVGAGDQMWRARIELVVSSGLSGDAARMSHEDASRADCEASFDAVRELCQVELRPVLECSVEMLSGWGLSARVTETLRDEPARVPRSFDLTLWIDRFGDRGPGKLTITATEGCDFVRVKMVVGPSKMIGEVSEHVGTMIAGDLSDALVGGLVANLVEQIFSS